jgi:hypothetical protein
MLTRHSEANVKALAILLTPIFWATVLPAQNAKDPVSSVVKEILPRQQKNLIAAAEEMPADKYGYKPTPEQISFAHLIMHISTSNESLCGKIGDVAAPKHDELKETDGKDKLVAAIKSSFDFCNAAVSKLEDSKLGDPVELRNGKGPRAGAVIALTNDWADHYGAAAMYLRLNGLLPPTAKGKKK